MVTAAMKLQTLAHWRKSDDKRNSVLESRDIISVTKAHILKAMVFPVIMYGCERWTIKEAMHQRTDAFEL